MSRIFNLSDTWDDAGIVFKAIKIDVTNTASAAGSSLIELSIDGVTAFRVDKTGDVAIIGNIAQQGANVQKTIIQQATTELTGLAGATMTATNLIPAGSFVIGVSAKVTADITGASSWDLGDGVDVDRWGAGIALTLSPVTTVDITDFTASGFGQFASANDVVLTANVANFTAGAVRLTVHYISLTAPTT